MTIELFDVIKLMFVSAMPIVELRGGIPMGVLMGFPALLTFVLCVVGNMLPVPFIILLWSKFFNFIKRGKLKRLLEKIQAKADSKKEQVEKYEKWGLYLFVAIPLPGTGAWTGALIAATLQMKLKSAIMPIFLGVLTAGVIMTIISYGGTAFIASLFS